MTLLLERLVKRVHDGTGIPRGDRVGEHGQHVPVQRLSVGVSSSDERMLSRRAIDTRTSAANAAASNAVVRLWLHLSASTFRRV